MRAACAVTAQPQKEDGTAETRPVMSGVGRGPTHAAPGHQATSVPATQLVAVKRKEFRGQHEPTDAIIGIRHGHNPALHYGWVDRLVRLPDGRGGPAAGARMAW